MPQSRNSKSRRSSRRRRRRRRRGGDQMCERVKCFSSACTDRENARAKVNQKLQTEGKACVGPKSAVAAMGANVVTTAKNMKKGFVLPLVARYVRDLIKPNTTMPKTRQLLLDSIIYAQLVAHKYMNNKSNFADSTLIEPKYGKHTYIPGEPSITGGDDDIPPENEPGAFKDTTGGRRRRSRRRRKSSKSRRKSKKSRKRKRSRSRRRR